MSPHRTMLLWLSFMLIPAGLLAGGPSPEPYRVPRVEGEIRCDGVLDEPFWSEALTLSIDYEVTPGENVPPPVKTECLLAYTETHIYIGFKSFDPDPSKIRARISDRDNGWADDWVGVFFDTFNDGLRDYGFVCNPLGVQTDMVETSDSEEGNDWDSIWDSGGKITSEGYFVEMSVPFSSLSFQASPGDQVWGLDAVRDYPRSVRHHLGVFPRDRNNNCYMCQAIKIVGFAGAKPGMNLELDPTLSGIFSQAREGVVEGPFVERERKVDPGLSLSWGFTPSMVLSAAANPDFSQVEADAVQLDINTKFALFYPEKRPFFTEGSDFFATRMSVLYTRTFADPDWGLKVSGKERGNVVGLFAVQDRVTNLVFPGSEGSRETSLDMRSVGSVLRYRRDVFGSSNLGIIATDREGDEYHNRLAGVDGNIRLSKQDLVQFQAVATRTAYPASTAAAFGQPGEELSGAAIDVGYEHETRNIGWDASYREVSRDFRADLGFIPQADYRASSASIEYTWNGDQKHWYTWIEANVGYGYAESLEGTLLEKGPTLFLGYEGPLQSEIMIEALYGREGYAGRTFDERIAGVDAGFWPTGSLQLTVGAEGGDRIDYENARQGKAIVLEPGISYLLGRHLSIGLSDVYERLAVDDGRLYAANATRCKAVYQFNRRTFVRALVQYVDYRRNASLYAEPVPTRESRMSSQLLFSYKINPQTVLFLGYSDAYFGTDRLDLVQTDRTFFAKIGYAWVP